MKNKLRIKLAILFVVCITAAVMLSSCGSSTTDIYILNSDLPRQTYVQGQELDLSSGFLTVESKDEEAKISFTSEGVSISGYDKDTLGTQTVTVTYDGATTSFTVDVIPRITAENYETKYFINDEFNKNAGKLKIAKDDASIFSVNFNDAKVSVVSFDIASAGTKTVTVRYTDGGNSYDFSYDVTVYDMSDVKFTAPQNTAYPSHKTDVDVTGGFFTITSSDGKLQKIVPLTADMVKTELAEATIENRTEPLSQTLNIEYLGKSFSYTVYITFSGVSIINYHMAGALKNVASTVALTEEQKNAAFDAINEYYKLSTDDRKLISKEDTAAIAGAGAIAVNELFQEEVLKYSGTFSMDSVGNLSLTCASYETVVEDLKDIESDKSLLNIYKNILRSLYDDFGDIQLVNGKYVDEIIVVYSQDYESILLTLLNHLTDVYSTIANIPEDWTIETLKNHGNDITSAVLKMANVGLYASDYADDYAPNGASVYYAFLSLWRGEKADFSEIIYSYYLYAYEGDSTFIDTYVFGNMPMPGDLELWYQYFNVAYGTASEIAQKNLADLSDYMFLYRATLEIAESIMDSGNTLWIDAYKRLNLDYLTQRYLGTFYLSCTLGMVDSTTYETLWEAYYTVLKLYKNEALNANNETHEQLLKMTYNVFESLTPAELLGFLSSLCYKYDQSSGTMMALSCEKDATYNTFAKILRDYYSTYLGKDEKPIFYNLLLAMENYAMIGHNPEALDNFMELMASVYSSFNALTDAEKENFKAYCQNGYNNYVNIYLELKGDLTFEPGEADKALIDELKATLTKYAEAYNLALKLSADQKLTQDNLVVLRALYAKAAALYQDIIGSESGTTIFALLTESLGDFADLNPAIAEFLKSQFAAQSGSFNLSSLYYLVDKTATSLMLGTAFDHQNEDGTYTYSNDWNLYVEAKLQAIYVKLADLLYYAFVNSEAIPDEKTVGALMLEIRNMEFSQLDAFEFIGDFTAYLNAEATYIRYKLQGEDEQTVTTLVDNMLAAENAYIQYRFDYEVETNKTAILTAIEAMAGEYEKLSEENQKYFAQICEYYLALYEKLSQSTEG